jgi:excisionase family DNA binding protein
MTTATNSERLLYRIPEAAALLGMSRTVIYELLAAGELTAVHIGASVRVTAASLREFVTRLEKVAK